ncbi:T-box transcription factor TBX22 [Exaiptasia diaphana]|nr:T-box transcription factor TBX22 [Exaiptasia diaphana]
MNSAHSLGTFVQLNVFAADVAQDTHVSSKRGSSSDEEKDNIDSESRPAKQQKVSEDQSDTEYEEDSTEINVQEDEPTEEKTFDAASDLKNIKVELEGRDLWERFNELGTEMIITKAGRSFSITNNEIQPIKNEKELE